MTTQTTPITQIAALLNQAGQAHHEYEQTVLNGVYDEDWPNWYAQYVIDQGVLALVQQPLTAPELAAFLKDNYEVFKSAHSQASWANYAAQQIEIAYGREQP